MYFMAKRVAHSMETVVCSSIHLRENNNNENRIENGVILIWWGCSCGKQWFYVSISTPLVYFFFFFSFIRFIIFILYKSKKN